MPNQPEKPLWKALLWASLAYFLALLVIGPWGDFPLNDDWQYAHVAKRLAETGTLVIDTRTAPSIVGQAYFVEPFIQAFSFSHTLLRVITIGLGWAGLAALTWLFASLGLALIPSFLLLLLTVFSPLYLYFSTTFMTELYGYVPALLAAGLWFHDRKRREPSELMGWPVLLACAVVSGGTFWVRQFCVLVFPALVGSWVLLRWLEKDYAALRRAWPRLLVATVVFVGIVFVYFPWAKAMGVYKPELSGPMSKVFLLRLKNWFLHVAPFVTLMTFLVYPVFFLFQRTALWPRNGWDKATRRLLAALVLLLGISLVMVWRRTGPDFHAADYFHRYFPFIGNVIYPGGIGVNTLSDVYLHHMPGLSLPQPIWWAVEVFVLALSLRWAPLLARMFRVVRESSGKPGEPRQGRAVSQEMLAFGFLFSLSSAVLAWQAYQGDVFDRYYFPCYFGVLLMLAVFLKRAPELLRSPEWRWRELAPFFVALFPLAVFTVGGLHDQFRWNEARWALFDETVKSGVPAANIEGGYEIDGWNYFEKRGAPDRACLGGECRCGSEWWECQDASYRIGMNVLPGYVKVSERAVSYWLVEGRPLMLSRRHVPEAGRP